MCPVSNGVTSQFQDPVDRVHIHHPTELLVVEQLAGVHDRRQEEEDLRADFEQVLRVVEEHRREGADRGCGPGRE